MKQKLLLAVCALLRLAVPAMADMYQDGSNAKLPDARRNLGIDTFNPMDYGAKCDSNGTTGTDDAAAINAMFAAIRARNKPFTVVGPENRTCYVASSINATELNSFGRNLSPGSSINLRLDCATNGTPCLDALGARWINWERLYLKGISTAPPSYGVQIGMVTAGWNADLHYFNQPVISGQYTVAAFYNGSSESNLFVEPFIQNERTAAGASYGMVLDGYNHFNITSTFVTVAMPADTYITFNDNTVINGWISGGGTTGAPIWIGGAQGHRWINGYAASTTPNCVQIFQTGGQGSSYLDFHMHCETNAITDVFRLMGPADSGVMKLTHFKHNDPNSQAQRSVFQADSSITDVLAQDVDIRISGFDNGGGDAVKLFLEPSKWQMTGHVYLPAVANWSPPGSMGGGEVCFRTPISCYTILPTACLAGVSGGLRNNAGVVNICP